MLVAGTCGPRLDRNQTIGVLVLPEALPRREEWAGCPPQRTSQNSDCWYIAALSQESSIFALLAGLVWRE